MKTFFDEQNRLERLTELGDTLIKLNAAVDWEIFRPSLDEIFYSVDERAGGRKPFDRVLMFKIMVLQGLYNVSDDSIEYQINDRLSFQRFLGLELGDKVPDAKTVWLYKEKLQKSGREKELFKLYTSRLEKRGLITKKGTLVDATFIERAEQKANFKGEDSRYDKPEKTDENPHKEAQYDADARYTKKHGKRYFGYKNHVKADADSKLIRDYEVTPASVHDGKIGAETLDESDNEVYMDSGYAGAELEKLMHEKAKNARIHISKRGTRGHKLTEEEKENDRPAKRVRARVEHIFGHMAVAMGGKTSRCVGLARTRLWVAFKNLAYNIYRAAYMGFIAQIEGGSVGCLS